ncbi:DUF2490 domain-containing protein [Pontibacter sp. G13]|uniref:DUF2490 domain-containing protein n=1 Tax=Pontibacter sp. G13 TaxID=3074898 RepID=UPI0028895DF2|nr:DUF2490 domain-containing protein [Pontibacter sp. G13]WNJ19992.1 DUF2490 domain-containing protein [Pontibacter sp. G13]
MDLPFILVVIARMPAGRCWMVMVLLGVGLHISNPLSAQTTQSVDPSRFQNWTEFQVYHLLNRRWELYYDVGIRYQLPIFKDWFRIHVRPSIQYNGIPWIKFNGGFGFFYTFSDPDLFEFRPWQGVRFPLLRKRRIKLAAKIRIEERFTIASNDHWQFAFRSRYQLGATIPINKEFMEKGTLYGVPSMEAFQGNRNVEEVFADRWRFDIGLGYILDWPVRVEVHYIFQNSFNNTTDSFNGDAHILRVRFTYRVKYDNY